MNHRAMSIPEATPALVVMGPSVTNSRSDKIRACGKARFSSGNRFQCVVQVRPSSNPALPKTNAAVHTAQMCAPAETASRSQCDSFCGTAERKEYPGTTTRSPGATVGNADKDASTACC